MALQPRTRTTTTWLLLSGLALGAWVLGTDHAAIPAAASLCVIGLALVKALLVLWEFMELKRAPRPWQAVLTAAIVVITVGMVALYLK